MPEILVDIEVWCSCGEGLCGQSDCVNAGRVRKHRGHGVIVEPCKRCLDTARDEGRREGGDE